ncbi:uncharacterized protein LOC132619672 [Lycium barbarum]|uniref:uncharacterized protein LOC132619672 n=1 Tax=Lycium barbarum TaxID=112863 RepID=UPI00293F062D|nr:uncharacterized protein LOC132619672 [Lycium barbarum]
MIQHPESSHIDPLRISLQEEHAHYCHVEAEPDGKPWYNDIKMYLEKREYHEGITNGQKKTIRRMSNGFFLNKEILYKRTLDLCLLRCVDADEASKLLEEVLAGTIISAEVEISSLRIIQEPELDNAEWVRAGYEKLALIDKKSTVAICHGQLCQQRMVRAFNKRVRTRLFQIRQMVLKRIFLHQDEYKEKFSPNWQGP